MTDPPNILLVIADQYRAEALTDDSYHTPNADELCRSGTRFDGCYTPHPQCSPARSSMVTGLYPHQTGVQALPNWPSDDVYALDPDSHSVGRTLRDAGYATAWFGRWDLGADNAESLGWETTGLDVTGSPGEVGRDRDEQTLADTVAFIESTAEPFFVTASFNLPHRPYYLGEAYADRYDADEVPIPANADDDLADKPPHQRAWAPGDVPEQYREDGRLTDAQHRELGRRYRTMVSTVDGYLGRLRECLAAEGAADDTVVVFVADHGDMAGGHGLFGKHTLAYEEELRVPLVIDRPGDQTAVVDELVSLTALPGTLIELAGLAVPPAFEGGSLADRLDGATGAGDGRVFFEHKVATGELHPFRGVRTSRYKYVDYFADEEAELYDLQADPGELTNLADDPAYADVRRRLHATVTDWWAETGGDEQSWSEPVPD